MIDKIIKFLKVKQKGLKVIDDLAYSTDSVMVVSYSMTNSGRMFENLEIISSGHGLVSKEVYSFVLIGQEL